MKNLWFNLRIAIVAFVLLFYTTTGKFAPPGAKWFTIEYLFSKENIHFVLTLFFIGIAYIAILTLCTNAYDKFKEKKEKL